LEEPRGIQPSKPGTAGGSQSLALYEKSEWKNNEKDGGSEGKMLCWSQMNICEQCGAIHEEREEQTGVANMHDWRTAEHPPWLDQQDGALLIQVLRPA
jgi:hypothetical protein